ncbi:sugar phosphate isomerase/epimerase [Streptomyces capparidis]
MPRDLELSRALTRRGILGAAAGTAAAAVALGAAPAAAKGGGPLVPRGRLGIQLYTVRDLIAAHGFAEVFEELSRIGYGQVELAGYTQGSAGPITLEQLRRLLVDNGLTAIGSHVGYWSTDPNATTFATNLTKVLDEAQALGLTHIGTPSNPNRYGTTVDGWKRAAEDFNTYGAAARARGMRFYQHNHAEEFAFADDRPSVRLYDLMLTETDPRLVYFELDVYWAYSAVFRYSVRPDGTAAPFDPLRYVLRDPRRFPLFHVKDGVKDPATRDGYRMTDVGDGDIDYRRFIRAVERTGGPHHWQVERDDAPNPAANPAGSLSTAARSYRHLRRCG